MYTIPRQYLYCEQTTSGSIVSALYRLDIRCIVYDTAPISILCANNIRPIYKLYYSIVSALYRLDIRCTVYTILGQYPYCVQTIITQYWANTCMYRKRIPIQYRANFTLFPGYCPQLVSWNTIMCFFKVYKPCIHLFGIFPRFLKNLLKSNDLVHGGFARTKSALCIVKLRFDYFTASLFKAFCIDLSRRLNTEMLLYVGISSCVLFCELMSAIALVPHQFSKLLGTHESANEPQSCS